MESPEPSSPPDFQWPTADGEGDEQMLAAIREHKAHIVSVAEEGRRPAFAYTLGLFLHFGHPELLIIGLPPEVCDDVLSEVIELIEAGSSFADGDESDDVLRGFPVRFVGVPSESYPDWLDRARWFNASLGEDAFPCVQVLWPSKGGRFPGQKGSPTWMKRRQPILGAPRP